MAAANRSKIRNRRKSALAPPTLAQGKQHRPPPLALRFDLNPPNLANIQHGLSAGRTIDYRLLSLPMYFIGQGQRLGKGLI